MSLFNPLGLIGLITVPTIILLYILKQKYSEKKISSLFLWKKVLDDPKSHSPWQKLRKNILMIIQILTMILIALALSKPFLNIYDNNAKELIIVIDSTFSMKARDFEGSRFEFSKKKAIEFVNNQIPNTPITVITIQENPIILENINTDKNKVIRTIQDLEPTNYRFDNQKSIHNIKNYLTQTKNGNIVWFSDKKPEINNIKINFYNTSKPSNNYAILHMSTKTLSESIVTLTKVANYSNNKTNIPLTLYVDGSVFDAKNVEINPNESMDVIWTDIPRSTIEIKCGIEKNDVLEEDNEFTTVVNHYKNQRALLVSDNNFFIEKFISLTQGVEFFKLSGESIEQFSGYDLYIYDGYIPNELPHDGNILIFNPTKTNIFETQNEIDLPKLQKSLHPFLKYIDEYSFVIGKSKTFKPPNWGDVILRTDEDIIAFSGVHDNKKISVFGFDIHNSDIALTIDFPIIMSNILDWYMPHRINNIESILPGEYMDFNFYPNTSEIIVINPLGKETKLAPPFPAMIYSETQEFGKYTLRQKIEEQLIDNYFVVNPPSISDSNLLKAKTVMINGEINSDINIYETGTNILPYLLWGILIFVCLEWFLYRYYLN